MISTNCSLINKIGVKKTNKTAVIIENIMEKKIVIAHNYFPKYFNAFTTWKTGNGLDLDHIKIFFLKLLNENKKKCIT